MTDIGLAVVALWLAVLSVLFSSLVRQLGSMQAAILGFAGKQHFDFDADGPELHSRMSERLRSILTDHDFDPESNFVALFMSAGCGPCRERAAEIAGLPRHQLGTFITIIAGDASKSTGDDLKALLAQASAIQIGDPDAHDIARLININSTPFAFRVERGTFVAKTYVRKLDDLVRLADSVDEELDPISDRS